MGAEPVTSTALLILNPRDIPSCMKALRALDVPKLWVSYMPEVLAAEACNRAIRETNFDRYVVVSDDTVPTQRAFDAVLEEHDARGGCVTGFCNLDARSPFCNLTRNRLHRPPPTTMSYTWWMISEIRNAAAAVPTTFAGLALTCMSRELWLQFPLEVTREFLGQMDYVLSYKLGQAGVSIVAPPDGFIHHVKETWNQFDRSLEKRLLIGEREAAVTWTDWPGEVAA